MSTPAAAAPPVAPVKEEELTLELVDDEQILAELQGMHFENDKFLFPIQGGYQLTYKAVKLACRMFEEKGEVLEVVGDVFTKYDEKDPEYLIAHVKVQRVKVNAKGQRVVLGSEVGTKRKWTKEALKNGEVRADKSFYEKACAQAQRNAKMALLPQDFLLEFTDMLLKKGAQRGGTPQRPAQPPARPAPAASAPAKPQGAPQGPAKAPEGPQKPAQAPAASQAPPAAPQAPAAAPPPAAPMTPEKRKMTMQQQFWAYLKSAVPQAKTEAQQRNVLKRLTGKDKVRELEESVIKILGPQLREVPKGEFRITDVSGTLVITHVPSGEVRWPVGFKPPAPPAAPAPAAAPTAPVADPSEAPPESTEPLF